MRDLEEELWKFYDGLIPAEKAEKLKALELLCKIAPPESKVKPEGRDPSLQRALKKVASHGKSA